MFTLLLRRIRLLQTVHLKAFSKLVDVIVHIDVVQNVFRIVAVYYFLLQLILFLVLIEEVTVVDDTFNDYLGLILRRLWQLFFLLAEAHFNKSFLDSRSVRPAEIVTKSRLPGILNGKNRALERPLTCIVSIRKGGRQESVQYFFPLLIIVLKCGVRLKFHDLTNFEFACIFHLLFFQISIIFCYIIIKIVQ